MKEEEEAARCVGYLWIYRISICEQLTSGVPSAGGLGEGLIFPHFTPTCYKSHAGQWDGLGSLECLRVLFGRPKGKRPLGWSGCRWIIWKFIWKGYDWKMWIGFIWLRIRTSFRVLWTWCWTLGLHKVQDVSWLEEEMWASKKQLLSMNLSHL